MTRPTDWSPIGYDRDPVPGDPLTVAGSAKTFHDIADEISKAESHLRNISINGQGEAIHKIRQKCDELAEKIKKARTICGGVDDALNPYVEVLEDAQEISLQELNNARIHRAEGENALRRREMVREQYNASQDPQQRNELRAEFMKYDGKLKYEYEQVGAARRRLQDAIDDRNRAAQTAAGKLQELVNRSGLKDSWWDKICGLARAIADICEKILPFLNALGTILAVIGLIVMIFVPGGQIALIVAIAALTVSVMTMAAQAAVDGRDVADGKKTWGEFFTKLAVNGIDVALAAFGVKGAAAAAKAAKAAKAADGASKTASAKSALEQAWEKSTGLGKQTAKEAAKKAAEEAAKEGATEATKQAAKEAAKKVTTNRIKDGLGVAKDALKGDVPSIVAKPILEKASKFSNTMSYDALRKLGFTGEGGATVLRLSDQVTKTLYKDLTGLGVDVFSNKYDPSKDYFLPQRVWSAGKVLIGQGGKK
ncbi:Uncharacterised protein [Actinomyces bovis]|uniref:Uncharacterized protein n=1 Tax=Actinomyces bovis TaxID=1658 RepID=A0ABY1VLH1_9ACTO|nr:hypothetical protein [Actinomyces bovis]SPT52951.1 Uncharacterised protein [Actinomyces bovis]VEG55141.1 Uncharacterised protein [Actinomyces israelii]